MPLGFGIMNIGRVTVYRTIASFTSVVPEIANCGDNITFRVQVLNETEVGPTPTGIASIIDINTNYVVASGTLSGGDATLTATLSYSSNNLIISYAGVLNQFAPSTSDPIPYNVNIINTTTTVNSDAYFCYSQSVDVSGMAIPNIGSEVLQGTMGFRLYDGYSYTDLASSDLGRAGDGYSLIPAFATTPGNSYWVQALYDGYECFNSSESSGGTSGFVMHSISNDVTSSTISGPTGFLNTASSTFTGITAATFLLAPSIGSVNFSASKGSLTLNLGNSSLTNGNSSVSVPGNTFAVGIWNVTANYITDGYCYANSTSSPLTINVS